MRAVVLIAVLCGGLLSQASAAQQKNAAPASPQPRSIALRPLPDEAVRQNARLTAALRPSARSKVVSAAAALAAAAKQQPAMTTAQIQSTARTSVLKAFPKLAGTDVDALVFMVMMQCAQDQQADLAQAMGSMQQNANSKQSLRGANGNSLDQRSEIGEEEELRLQMAMDRLSKFEQVLSNVMKAVDDTQTAIVANLK